MAPKFTIVNLECERCASIEKIFIFRPEVDVLEMVRVEERTFSQTCGGVPLELKTRGLLATVLAMVSK